jgi:hypothetical protein
MRIKAGFLLVVALSCALATADAKENLQSRSRIGGLGFAYPAAPSSDPFYAQMIGTVAEVRDEKCVRSEAFAWRPADRVALEKIFAETMYAFKVTGYKLTTVDLALPKVIAYEAQSRDRTAEDHKLLVGWVIDPPSVNLVLCRLHEEEQ